MFPAAKFVGSRSCNKFSIKNSYNPYVVLSSYVIKAITFKDWSRKKRKDPKCHRSTFREIFLCLACTPPRYVIGIYKVHWMNNQTAPVDVLELVICDCKKGKCSEKMAMYLTTSFLY